MSISNIDRYIHNILLRTECSEEERNDLFDEFKSHLETAKQDYMNEGYSEDEAESAAIGDFGQDVDVGDKLQETMYPFRKDLLYFIGFGTIVYTLFTFLHYTVTFSGPPLIWMTLSILLGAAVVFFGFNPSIAADKKILVNSILVSLNAFYLFGFLLLDTSDEWYVSLLNILDGVLIIVSIVMVFLTALKAPANIKNTKGRKSIHILNLTLGIVLFGYSIIMGLGTLFFVGLSPALLIPVAIMVTWAASYWIQYKLIIKYKSAYFALGLSTTTFAGFIAYFLIRL